MNVNRNKYTPKIAKIIILASFFFLSHCGWAGFNQTGNANEKNQQNLILGIVGLSRNSSIVSSNSAPTVISILPSTNATDIPINSSVVITFSSEMDISTLNTTNLIILDESNPIATTVTPISKNEVLVLPTTSFSNSKTYIVNVSTEVKDTNGIALVSSYSSFFTTATDNQSFSVASVSPSNTSLNVSIISGILITFNKEVDPTTLIAANITVTASGSPTANALTITPIGTTSALLLSNSPMVHSTLHILQITSGVKDTLGNSLATTPFTSLFTTFNSDPDSGSVTTLAGTGSAGNVDGTGIAASFSSPQHLTMNIAEDTLYITDTGNHRIRRVGAANGVVTNIAGLTSGYTAGTGTAARFNSPKGIAIDSIGNIFISDSGNHSIRMITASGVVSTIAGSGSSGYANGFGNAATFNNPTDIAIDGDGILYVADGGNCSIRKLLLNDTKTSATVTTYAGATPDITASNCGFINGTRLVSRFNNPTGLWLATNNKLYITDTGNHAIRVIEN